ncbi:MULTISPECIES: DEAD/DEAH box helicase [Actinomyces]|uniref:RNA helicase n=2 Tax=Actinomyces respiraculi TaxID=2744574 RepID=A0A7T0PWH3_9ACTO|nr:MULTISPECIES: DEAD/DEAH box helicase [Actinomyces]QPL06426.1 DEAD/DEAH box helicase [Actinomyces respiraculi]
MTPGSTTPSDGPLSLDALFKAEVNRTDGDAVASPTDSTSAACADSFESASSFDTPASSDSPEDPEDVDHEDEEDDVDTAAALALEENDPEDPDDEAEVEDDGAEDLDEDEVDGHAPFVDDGEDEEEQVDKAPEEVTFSDLGLPADLLKAVTDMGFTTPTPIQREAIPVLLGGRDVVGVAQTGTGKTAAFGLPLLDAVDSRDGTVQALVLAPTRELAIQSTDAITDMAQRSRGLDVVAVYGGAPYGPQIGALKGGAQVVVGTPGRIIDLIEKGALHLEDVRFFVLDEADEMLRMGFAEDVETIASSLPAERRTALFSATMPPAIQAVARQHLTDPQRIEVSRQSSTVDTVHQTYAVVPFRHKIGAVSRVLAVTDAAAAIVFVRTKSTAEDVAIELAGRGIQAAAISGDVPQRERERLVERLRQGTLDVLVATDVAARGLDVERIGLVVNFDVPREAGAYVHRIGRTGRAGRHGEAVTFLTPKEKGKLRQIERLTGTRLEEITLPSPADVSRHRAGTLLGKAAARLERGRLEMYTELVTAKAAELEIEVEDLAATLMALAVGDEGPRTWKERKEEPRQRVRREETVDSEGTFVSASFEGGRDRDDRRGRGERPDGKPGAARGGRRRHEDGTGTVYRVEVGHRDRVLPGAIVGALANEGGISGSDIGKIDILQSFSLVEIHAPLSAEQLEAMSHATFGGRELRIHPDEGPGRGWDGSDNPSSESQQRRTERPRFDRDGERGGFRRDNDRGGFRGGRGGFRGGRDGERGGFRRDNDRGGFRGGRDNERGGFRGGRDGERGGFRRDNDRGGFRGGRDNERGGFRRDNDRGGFRGGRDSGRGGFRRDNDRW